MEEDPAETQGTIASWQDLLERGSDRDWRWFGRHIVAMPPLPESVRARVLLEGKGPPAREARNLDLRALEMFRSGRSLDEIREFFGGATAERVRQRLHRALARLRSSLRRASARSS